MWRLNIRIQENMRLYYMSRVDGDEPVSPGHNAKLLLQAGPGAAQELSQAQVRSETGLAFYNYGEVNNLLPHQQA